MVEDREQLNLTGFLKKQYVTVDEAALQQAIHFIITHVDIDTLESMTYNERVAIISLVYYYIYNDTLGSVAHLLSNLFDLLTVGDKKKAAIKIVLFAQQGATVDIKLFRLRKNEQQLFNRN